MLGAARQAKHLRCGCAQSSSAHTYRLRIFKERWLRGEDLNL
jgi:hypothetical protein